MISHTSTISLQSPSVLFLLLTIPTCFSFHLPPPAFDITPTTSTSLHSYKDEHSSSSDETGIRRSITRLQDNMKGALTASLITTSLWALPCALYSTIDSTSMMRSSTVTSPLVANAKEMASGSGSRVNKDPESLLRYGLPIPKDKEIRKFQTTVEDIKLDIGSKRKSAAIEGVKNTKKQLQAKSGAFTGMCREPSTCTSVLEKMSDLLEPLDAALKDASDTLNGSEQERGALDRAYGKQDDLQKLLTTLEEQMVPKGYKTPVPKDYSDLPQLTGRATVEFIVKKPENAPYQVGSKNFKEAKMVMVIDGFAAPVTSGNFIELVQKGFYDKMNIQRSDGFVIQTGDPEGEADGYVGTPSKSIGAGKHGERLIPSEIFVKGDKGPFYETTIEDEGRGGQATILPFSSYGAMGWAREEYDANSGSSQFFWLLFDSDLTPAGKNVIDGSYPCFGYVVEGADFLTVIKEGDIITSAKVTDGADLLISPKES